MALRKGGRATPGPSLVIPGSRVLPGLRPSLFIHELFEILHNLLKYNSKLNNPEKQSVFCTGWKACATKFFAVWRIIQPAFRPG